MSFPLASVVNPQDPNQVLVFYLTGNKSTGLELYDVGAETTTVTRFTDNLSSPVSSNVIIVNPGSFSALNNNHLINLYGLVNSVPGGPKRLTQLSPVYKQLLPDAPADSPKPNTAIGVAMTTIVDAKGQGYLYCLTGDEQKPRITEFLVGWTSSKRGDDIITKPLDDSPPLLASNLAAVYEPATGKRLVVYQNSANLHIVESTSNNDTVIPNTDDSRDSTGLALVPLNSDKGTKLYLYYFSQKGGKLQRVVRNEDGKWQDSAAAGDGNTVSETNTFLSATKVGSVIMVYYSAQGEKGIHSFRDQI